MHEASPLRTRGRYCYAEKRQNIGSRFKQTENGAMMALIRRISALPDLKGRSADYVKIYSLFVHKSTLSKTTILQEGKNK